MDLRLNKKAQCRVIATLEADRFIIVAVSKVRLPGKDLIAFWTSKD